MSSVNGIILAAVLLESVGTCPARSSASKKLMPCAAANSATLSCVAAPIPRFGTFRIRRTAMSSAPLSTVLRYASRSLISFRA